MTWVGSLEWSAPEGHWDIENLALGWRGEGEFSLFWVAWVAGEEEGTGGWGLYTQRYSVDEGGAFTRGNEGDDGTVLLRTIPSEMPSGERVGMAVTNVTLTESGAFELELFSPDQQAG